MKKYTIDIHPELKGVTFTVKNGAAFERDLIAGKMERWSINVSPQDLERVKKFALRRGRWHHMNKLCWNAQCGHFAMDLYVEVNRGYSNPELNVTRVSIDTYRPYGGAGTETWAVPNDSLCDFRCDFIERPRYLHIGDRCIRLQLYTNEVAAIITDIKRRAAITVRTGETVEQAIARFGEVFQSRPTPKCESSYRYWANLDIYGLD